jgi:hypothetical protein
MDNIGINQYYQQLSKDMLQIFNSELISQVSGWIHEKSEDYERFIVTFEHSVISDEDAFRISKVCSQFEILSQFQDTKSNLFETIIRNFNYF